MPIHEWGSFALSGGTRAKHIVRRSTAKKQNAHRRKRRCCSCCYGISSRHWYHHTPYIICVFGLLVSDIHTTITHTTYTRTNLSCWLLTFVTHRRPNRDECVAMYYVNDRPRMLFRTKYILLPISFVCLTPAKDKVSC